MVTVMVRLTFIMDMDIIVVTANNNRPVIVSIAIVVAVTRLGGTCDTNVLIVAIHNQLDSLSRRLVRAMNSLTSIRGTHTRVLMTDKKRLRICSSRRFGMVTNVHPSDL
jgi:hypothetical protein